VKKDGKQEILLAETCKDEKEKGRLQLPWRIMLNLLAGSSVQKYERA